jgi:predicted small lipoprotein YifL
MTDNDSSRLTWVVIVAMVLASMTACGIAHPLNPPICKRAAESLQR